MKIIEALKNLKTIQKRLEKNCQQIGLYSAYVNVEGPDFNTEDEQKKELESLVQSNLDLEKEYLRLKKAIEHTNLAVKVTIEGLTYSITELISLKRVAGKFRINTYNAMHQTLAVNKLQQFYRTGQIDVQSPPKVIALYDEGRKVRAIREWEDFLSKIDGTLEVVNAETELQGY